MMPMNEAMVITATSLCATWDSSWASTPSSSRSSRLLRSIPVVTTSTEVLVFRPVANAFSIGDGAIATRGLGMLASAHSRSTIPCSRAASALSCGADHPAPGRAQRDLVGVEERAHAQGQPEQHREEDDAAARHPARWR